ncbi:XRE family transcriptional regulator [Candidatus Dojkabacteria bacterium]|uniref:XRE family transcriptional regulator n=1 Tax=Candidatus Dojkabacteria bacterium TaxID=2099670 RepID=A0A5C7JAM5_9BACT|nr:MAG: XRE family transcriptional regulator [Candidatus Dojkabacteria bacterium]
MTPEELLTIRKNNNLTQAKMAESIGISICQYKRLEKGKCKIKPSLALLIRALHGLISL